MKKKATVLLALISVCLIVTAGIGAISASDEPVVIATVSKINADGTTTVVKTFEGSGPMVGTATVNEDGRINIPKAQETELPVNIEYENGSITADILEPAERIDASARNWYYKSCAWNHATSPYLSVCVESSNINGGARTEASDGYVRWWVW